MIAVLSAILGVCLISLSLVFGGLTLGAMMPGTGRGPARAALALCCSVVLFVCASAVLDWGGW